MVSRPVRGSRAPARPTPSSSRETRDDGVDQRIDALAVRGTGGPSGRSKASRRRRVARRAARRPRPRRAARRDPRPDRTGARRARPARVVSAGEHGTAGEVEARRPSPERAKRRARVLADDVQRGVDLARGRAATPRRRRTATRRFVRRARSLDEAAEHRDVTPRRRREQQRRRRSRGCGARSVDAPGTSARTSAASCSDPQSTVDADASSRAGRRLARVVCGDRSAPASSPASGASGASPSSAPIAVVSTTAEAPGTCRRLEVRGEPAGCRRPVDHDDVGGLLLRTMRPSRARGRPSPRRAAPRGRRGSSARTSRRPAASPRRGIEARELRQELEQAVVAVPKAGTGYAVGEHQHRGRTAGLA